MRSGALLAAAVLSLLPASTWAQQGPPIVTNAPPPPPVVAPGQPPASPPIVVQSQVYVAPAPSYALGRRTLPYEEGQPIPPGYTLREKPRLGLLIGGSVMFGVTYLLSLAAYAVDNSICDYDFEGGSCESDLWPLSIPVAGPFIAMGSDSNSDSRAILLLDGIAQAGGVVMFILGFTAKKTVLVRSDLAEVHVVPLAYGGALRGMAVAGQF